MARPHELTANRVRALLSYDLETGLFTWRESRGRAVAGAFAGSPNSDGYVCIGIDRKRYAAHRLAWLYMTGAWPAGELDHRNCEKTDNAWSNLRVADRSGNQANKKKNCTNTSGFKGVHFNKHAGRWRSILKFRGASYFLGYFDTAESAHRAYCAKASEVHGDFARAC
jgi:hypothetical protein